MSTRTFDTRNGHVTIDTATHKAVPKDAIVLDLASAPAHIWLCPNPAEGAAMCLRDRGGRFAAWVASEIEAQWKAAQS